MFTKTITTSFIALSLLAAGCVSHDGTAPAIAEFDFEAGFHVEANELENGAFKAENGDTIALSSLKLNLSEIRLVSKSVNGGNGAKFDPSNPPEPYENCHANHCHIKGSDATKSFAEIEAELSGGQVQATDVLVLHPNQAIELTSLTTPVEIEGIAEGDLPYGEINEIHVVFDTYSLDAKSTATDQTVSLKNEHAHGDHVHTETLELSHSVDIDIVKGEEQDQDIHLIFEVHADILTEAFGDDVELAELMAKHAELEIGGHDHDHDHEH